MLSCSPVCRARGEEFCFDIDSLESELSCESITCPPELYRFSFLPESGFLSDNLYVYEFITWVVCLVSDRSFCYWVDSYSFESIWDRGPEKRIGIYEHVIDIDFLCDLCEGVCLQKWASLPEYLFERTISEVELFGVIVELYRCIIVILSILIFEYLSFQIARGEVISVPVYSILEILIWIDEESIMYDVVYDTHIIKCRSLLSHVPLDQVLEWEIISKWVCLIRIEWRHDLINSTICTIGELYILKSIDVVSSHKFGYLIRWSEIVHVIPGGHDRFMVDWSLLCCDWASEVWYCTTWCSDYIRDRCTWYPFFWEIEYRLGVGCESYNIWWESEIITSCSSVVLVWFPYWLVYDRWVCWYSSYPHWSVEEFRK